MGPTAAANVFPSHSELKQTTREGLKQHDTHDKQSIDCNPTHRPSLIETYMFFCLQKNTKQCCDITKLNCTHCSGQSE